jgi:50S ribosomal protein L16 3-hydroxylase
MSDDGCIDRPLDGANADEFLRNDWRRNARCFRAAIAGVDGLVDANELAGLACEDDVDSRLVFGTDEQDHWYAQSGPFEAKRFSELPESGWTLLVQSVDAYDDAVAALLDQFDFLPRWALDDIMVSYATAGGGVGPHFDHYDVFLIQSAGRRRWRVGQRCDDHTPLRDHDSLKLLARFETSAEYELEPGDMLYVPAGLAHWGSAIDDDCITCSVGFRAPAEGEVIAQAAQNLAETLGQHRRVTAGSEQRPTDRFALDENALDAIFDVWQSLDEQAVRTALTQALGALVTESRLALDLGSGEVGSSLLFAERSAGLSAERDFVIEHAPAVRFAWAPRADGAWLFVNGESFATSLALAKGVCAGGLLSDVDPLDMGLLKLLVERGFVHVD